MGTWSWGSLKPTERERQPGNLELKLANRNKAREATWELGAGAGKKTPNPEVQPGNLELGLVKASKVKGATWELVAGAGKSFQSERGNLGTWSWGWLKPPKLYKETCTNFPADFF